MFESRGGLGENPAMDFYRMTFRAAAGTLAAFGAILLAMSCAGPGQASGNRSASAAHGPGSPEWVFEDFEKPDPPVSWTPATATETSPATQAAAVDPAPTATEPTAATNPAAAAPASPAILHRSATRPDAGLWSLAANVTAAGTIRYSPRALLDFSRYTQLTLQVSHTDPAGRNGAYTASAAVIDAGGSRFESDAFPVLSSWEPVELDLRAAAAAGIDLAHIAGLEVVLRTTGPQENQPLTFQTDSWTARMGIKKYVGDRDGRRRSFFIESDTGQIRVGTLGQYEMVFSDRGAPVSAAGQAAVMPAPWLNIFSAMTPGAGDQDLQSISLEKVLGQDATGLMLLDQAGLDALGSARRSDSDTASAGPAASAAILRPWPPASATLARSHWEVAWSSNIAAMIEGTQEFGPYDRLGEPSVMLNWRFMVYQWGQAFVHVKWTKPGEDAQAVPDPITWALALDPSDWPGQNAAATALTAGSADAQERLLADMYTPVFRDGLKSALPHQMQSATPITLIAPANPEKDNFWWAQAARPDQTQERRRLVGAGLAISPGPPALTGQADCMLLVNNPDPLTRAGTFSQYLSPPKLTLRQGELDLTVPGDVHNDGFNEAYGFQAIRLSSGRAAFTIYPQNRPILYPVFLFTVPAIERNALDVKHSRLLVNVDGRQFADPPVFPDGSFLLQVPYVLDRPVTVEAVLDKR